MKYWVKKTYFLSYIILLFKTLINLYLKINYDFCSKPKPSLFLFLFRNEVPPPPLCKGDLYTKNRFFSQSKFLKVSSFLETLASRSLLRRTHQSHLENQSPLYYQNSNSSSRGITRLDSPELPVESVSTIGLIWVKYFTYFSQRQSNCNISLVQQKTSANIILRRLLIE